MIVLVRVDNRLIHGQVVETWLPHLKAARVVVADDQAAADPLIRAAMGLAVLKSTEVLIRPLLEVDYPALGEDPVRTLVLIREVAGVVAAREKGLPLQRLNVGNVHFSVGRAKVSPSVFLSPGEVDQLKMLAQSGAEVEVRAVPADRAIGLTEVQARLGKGA
ncbi:MAG: PTS sugar transporter subunit IIB [Myxococcales bacterium]|nr:PTS sugar transporter subunit IIB [Myxococcales bacterium]